MKKRRLQRFLCVFGASEKSRLLDRTDDLVGSVTEFETETDTLKDKATVLQNEKTILKQETETSNKQLSDLRMQLAATVEEQVPILLKNASILSDIGQAEREIEELRKSVSMKLQLANEKSSENEKMPTDIERLRINLEEANQQNVRLVQELNAAKEKNCVLESEMLSVSTQKREAERTIEELRIDHEALEDARLKLLAFNEELVEKARAKDTTNGELLDKNRQLEEKLGEATAKVARSEAEKANAGRETEALHGAIDALEAQLHLPNRKLETETEHKAEERDRRRMDELTEERCSLQEQVASLASRTNVLETELAEIRRVLEIELTSVGNAFLNLETAFDKNCRRFKAQLAKGAEELGAAKEMLKVLVSRKEKLEDEKNELAERLESARVGVLNLEEEVGGLRAKLAATVEEGEEFKEKAARNEKRVMELQRKVREEEEVVRQRAEEKREAIRQLCQQIDYHRQNSGSPSHAGRGK